MSPDEIARDQELRAKLSLGDRSAFEEIYRLYVDEVYEYTSSVIGPLKAVDSIIVEVFVTLWINRMTIGSLTLKEYLYEKVRFKILYYMRFNEPGKPYLEQFLNHLRKI